jgi:hypothetical protein
VQELAQGSMYQRELASRRAEDASDFDTVVEYEGVSVLVRLKAYTPIDMSERSLAPWASARM